MATVVALAALVVVAASGSIGAYLRARRASDIATVAARAGLQYADVDPFDCTRVTFHAFARGDGRGAEHVMWRDADDGHVYRSFDFWWFDEHHDQYGRTNRSYHRYSGAMALVGSAWPDISIVRAGVVSKLVDAVAGDELSFESEEFNRTFEVRCADRRFATALLDAQLLELLLSTKGELNFEIKGRWLLVWTSPVAPKLLPGLLHVAERFVAAIPKVVWDLYPSTFVDGEGRPLPPGDDVVTRMQTEVALAEAEERSDPFAVLAHSPFEALERHDGVEYDLDGHRLPPVHEDPWGTGRT